MRGYIQNIHLKIFVTTASHLQVIAILFVQHVKALHQNTGTDILITSHPDSSTAKTHHTFQYKCPYKSN